MAFIQAVNTFWCCFVYSNKVLIFLLILYHLNSHQVLTHVDIINFHLSCLELLQCNHNGSVRYFPTRITSLLFFPFSPYICAVPFLLAFQDLQCIFFLSQSWYLEWVRPPLSSISVSSAHCSPLILRQNCLKNMCIANAHYSISCHSSQLFCAAKPGRNSWWLLWSAWVYFSSSCSWFFSYLTAISSQFISISSWGKKTHTKLQSCFIYYHVVAFIFVQFYSILRIMLICFLRPTINFMFKHYCCHIGCVFICCFTADMLRTWSCFWRNYFYHYFVTVLLLKFIFIPCRQADLL